MLNPSYNIQLITVRGLDEIGLCTSTRWSPGTWQLLLMFHWDRVNRLPEQTQRRTYGCASLALRRVGAKKKFLLGGWAPTKLQKHDQHVLTYNQLAWITTPISISASPLLLHSIARYTVRHLYNTHACRKPAISLFIHPPSKSHSSTHLLRPLIHPPLLFNSPDLPHAAYYPPLFIKDLG
jgi:hypothetical protein